MSLSNCAFFFLQPTAPPTQPPTPAVSCKEQRAWCIHFALLSPYQVISPILFAFMQPTNPTVQTCVQWYVQSQSGSGTSICRNDAPPSGSTTYPTLGDCCNALSSSSKKYKDSCSANLAAVPCPTPVPVTPQPTATVSIFVHLSVLLTSSQA